MGASTQRDDAGLKRRSAPSRHVIQNDTGSYRYVQGVSAAGHGYAGKLVTDARNLFRQACLLVPENDTPAISRDDFG